MLVIHDLRLLRIFLVMLHNSSCHGLPGGKAMGGKHGTLAHSHLEVVLLTTHDPFIIPRGRGRYFLGVLAALWPGSRSLGFPWYFRWLMVRPLVGDSCSFRNSPWNLPLDHYSTLDFNDLKGTYLRTNVTPMFFWKSHAGSFMAW